MSIQNALKVIDTMRHVKISHSAVTLSGFDHTNKIRTFVHVRRKVRETFEQMVIRAVESLKTETFAQLQERMWPGRLSAERANAHECRCGSQLNTKLVTGFGWVCGQCQRLLQMHVEGVQA